MKLSKNDKIILVLITIAIIVSVLFVGISLVGNSATHREQAKGAVGLIGTYKGTYSAPQGVTGATIDVYKNNDGIVEATFEFYPTSENPSVESGKFRCGVVFDNDTDTYSIAGTSWIERAPSYIYAGYAFNGALTEGKFAGMVYYQGLPVGSFEFARV